jgi:hypothetical protein
VTDQDKPGTDWQAKHDAAGSNAGQPQHSSYTTADGPVQQHTHPMNDGQILDMLRGDQ